MRGKQAIGVGVVALALLSGAGWNAQAANSETATGQSAAAAKAPVPAVHGYQIVKLPNANVPNFRRRTVSCPTGMKVIGGGAEAQGKHAILVGSFPTDDGTGWLGRGWQDGSSTVGISVYAICATASAEQKAQADKGYCTKQGGEYNIFVPFAGQLGQGRPLGGSEDLCVFWDKDHKAKITVTAEALNAPKPTLAELAYNHPPKPNPRPVGNPADAYCPQIGGTDSFGGQPGYWVIKGQENHAKFDNATDLCVFADMSAIDPWGLRYHAGGVIRGQDLTGKWRAHA